MDVVNPAAAPQTTMKIPINTITVSRDLLFFMHGYTPMTITSVRIRDVNAPRRQKSIISLYKNCQESPLEVSVKDDNIHRLYNKQSEKCGPEIQHGESIWCCLRPHRNAINE
jgi:hypothetical protein